MFFFCFSIGYYCPDGTVNREPPATFCPIGHYCPEGVAAAIPCRNNTEVSYLPSLPLSPSFLQSPRVRLRND